MAPATCNCFDVEFVANKCETKLNSFIISGYENTKPFYIGVISGIEYKFFWDGTQWNLQQTDPLFPEIPFYSSINDDICNISGVDWQTGDLTNFPINCNNLALNISQTICPCNCYKILPLCTTELEYIDCDGVTQYMLIEDGVTYYVCSQMTPIFACDGGSIINLGKCVDGICTEPTTTTTTIPITTTTTTFFPPPPVPLEPTNECDVITIFPMGVECFSINPSFTDSFDGSASLYITGGTPPYEILWENGSVGTTINNLGVGTYVATVTDSYGDFLINSSCVLTAETPFTTTTTSTTILPQFGDLCMVITEQSNSQFIDFIYDGYFNGNPSWLSNDSQYLLYWNTGTTGEWLVSGFTTGVVYNPNPTKPPIVGWSYLGGGSKVISVIEGSCSSIPPLSIQISTNNPSCVDDGSIIINTTGGIPPYLYSKDGGTTYQTNPIFNNLGAGNYLIYTQDSLGNTQTQLVTLTANSVFTTYTISLIKIGNNLSVNISPSLPNGVSVAFDLVFNTIFSVSPSTSNAIYNGNINVLVNGSPFLPGPPVINNSSSFYLPCSGPKYITNTTLVWSNIVINNMSTFSGLITDTITPVLPSPDCFFAGSSYTVSLNNARISGCNCCNVLIIQPPGKADLIG